MNKETYLDMRKEIMLEFHKGELLPEELGVKLTHLTLAFRKQQPVQKFEKVPNPVTFKKPQTDLNKRQLAMYKKMRSQGLTNKLIAEHMGIAEGTLTSKMYIWRNEGLLEFVKEKPLYLRIAEDREKLEQYKRWISAGVKLKVIAKNWELSSTTMHNVKAYWLQKGLLGGM